MAEALKTDWWSRMRGRGKVSDEVHVASDSSHDGEALIVRGSVAGEFAFILGLAYLVESPLYFLARQQITSWPSLLTFWEIAGVLFAVAQIPLAWGFVAGQATCVTLRRDGILVEERRGLTERRSRFVAWSDLRSADRIYPSFSRIALRPSNILASIYVSFSQAKAIVNHPCCPILRIESTRLRTQLMPELSSG